MIELQLGLIDEGRLLQQMNAALREGHKELQHYREETGDSTGKVTIELGLELAYDPEMKDHIVITHGVRKKVPARKARTIVKDKGGYLLVQPIGSDRNSPDQFRLFGADGKPIGTWSEAEGVIEEPPAVAGKIASGSK